MLRDVLLKSIEKGVVVIVMLLFILALVLARMPTSDLTAFLNRIYTDLGRVGYIGYVLAILFLYGWRKHMKWLSNKYEEEIRRIGKEKTVLQERLKGGKMESSGRED